ncbi:anaphase-promoting complex subunit 5-like, partial [Saccoglossus kowalevskii]
LLSAISVLNHIAIGFQKTEVQFKLKEVLYIQAQIYGELGYSVERNKCALMFRQLDLQYPASICPPLMTL